MKNQSRKKDEVDNSRNCKKEEIIKIYKAFISNDSFFAKEIKTKRNEPAQCPGHLIEYKQIEKLKKIICYDSKIKNDENIIERIFKKGIEKIKIPYITEENISNYEDFLNSIKKGTQFVFVTNDLWKLISYKSDNKNNKEIIISFQGENIIEIIFNDKRAKFKLDEKNNFIIDTNSLIDEKNHNESKDNRNNNKYYYDIIINLLNKIKSIEINEEKEYFLLSKDIKKELEKLIEKGNVDNTEIEIDRSLFNIQSNLDSNLNIKLKKYNKNNNVIIEYFDEFFLIDTNLFDLMIQLKFRKKEIKKVQCIKLNENEIFIFDKQNKIKQIGKLNSNKVFITTFLIESKNIPENLIKEIKSNKGIDNYIIYSTKCLKKDKYYQILKDEIYIYPLFFNKQENSNKENNDDDMLLYYFQNGLNILLSILSFQFTLKGKLTNSIDKKNFEDNKCYIISKKWLKKYKDIYLYKELLEMIIPEFEEDDLIDLTPAIKKVIFINMFNKYKKAFKNNIKGNGQKYLNFKKEHIKEIILSNIEDINPNEIDIINENILNNLINNNINKSNKSIDKNNLKINNYEYNIKENKLFIKNIDKEKNKYNLIIFK